MPTLFNWQPFHELELKRGELARQIARLPKHSHRRVALEYKLKELTAEAVRLECEEEPNGTGG